MASAGCMPTQNNDVDKAGSELLEDIWQFPEDLWRSLVIAEGADEPQGCVVAHFWCLVARTSITVPCLNHVGGQSALFPNH